MPWLCARCRPVKRANLVPVACGPGP
jgi:hypothetical protein